MIAKHQNLPIYLVLLAIFLLASIIVSYRKVSFRCCKAIRQQLTAGNWGKTPPLEIAWSVLGAFKEQAPFDDIDYLRRYFQKNNATKRKTILRVGEFNFDHLRWKDGSTHLQQINCPVTNCHFTSNLSVFRTADALVISQFHEKELKRFSPKLRQQVWIAQHLEPPYHNRLNPRLLNGLVNWTATYRRDSTIALPYSTWLTINEIPADTFRMQNYAEGRTKKVAMFVSNCNDRSGRLQYAAELNKTIPVHIYGGCGSLNCPIQKRDKDGEKVCFSMLRKHYKFYLSFENSNCYWYITEKLHRNALSNDIVPVVMGARPEDYALAAPPGSYIHVDDFKSPRHLGEYLNLLDSNDSLYNEFFRYKLRYRQISLYQLTGAYWCHLCTLLHLTDYTNITGQSYDDYEKWWNGACNYKFKENNHWKTWKEVAMEI